MSDPTIDELLVGDPPEAWRGAGFTVDDDGCCTHRHRAGSVSPDVMRASASAPGSCVTSLPGSMSPTLTVWSRAPPRPERGPVRPAVHANGARLIDHLVVATPDMARTVKALEATGLDVRRVRDTDAET